ncbi:hypothetical protein EDD22DRAFT_770699 [Suillus occidentalis]|nr:hypothetical protein EDD22DRAFT_770699 [Suillus occidentalis]
MADPSLEVCPDFASEFYEAIRADLAAATNAGPQEIIDRLVETWMAGHDVRVAEWNRRRDEEAQEEEELRLVRAAREEEEHLARQAEEENEHLESEKKKPKMNSFNVASTIGDTIAPHPSQYAIQKLNNFEYIELWYFSPDGCKEAMKTLRSIADDTFSLTRLDDHLTIRPTSASKASKAALPDHELSFSTFLRAKNLFLTQASNAKWPQANLDALALFFWHLENHAIRNNSEIGDIVILHYASRIHQEWHDRLKRDEAFNIGIINETLLRTINEEMWDWVRSRSLNTVRNFFPCHYAATITNQPCAYVPLLLHHHQI